MTKHVGLALAALALVSASIVNAQVNAAVGGTVADQTGAVVPAVTVTATNVNTGIVTTRQTNESGAYDFASLQPGNYTISAAFSGFRTATFRNVELGQGQQVRQNFSLQPADANQSVEVVAEADTVLSTTSASVGSVLADKVVASLPVLSRNVMDLVATSPGVVTIQGAFGPVVNFSGASAGQTNTTRDGLVTNDGRYNDSNGAYSAIFTSPDMVEEVRISTNSIDPAAGRGIGQVQLRTRAGTNEYHGALFYTNQNSALSSNEFFANLRGAPKSYINRNQYGGRLGGPVIKNKAFFFVLIDNQRFLQKELVTTPVLTATARQGIFRYLSTPTGTRRNGNALGATPSVDLNGNILTSAGGVPLTLNQFNLFSDVRDPNRTRIDPVWFGSQYLQRMPLPNDFSVGDGLNTAGIRWFRRLDGFDGSTGISANPNRDHVTARGDYQINQNHRLTYTMSYENNSGRGAQPGLPGYPDGFFGSLVRKPRFYTGAWTAVLSATLLNDFRIGYKMDPWQGGSPFDEGCCFNGASDTTRDEASQAATNAFPRTSDGHLIHVLPGVLTLGTYAPFGVSAPRLNKSPLTQFADTVTLNKAAHSLQFGFEMNRFNSAGNNTGAQQTTRPQVTLGIGSQAVSAIGAGIAPNFDTNDNLAAQQLLSALSGTVASISQHYFVNSPSDTNWLDYRNTYVFTRKHHQNDFAFFAKDSWKISRNLTLNLGLRYDKYGVPYDSAGLGSRFTGGQSGAFGISGTSFANAMWAPGATEARPANGGTLTRVEFVGKNSPNPGQTIFGNDWNNFAPSLGFSYNVQGLGRTTVIRGGYGINYAGAADFLSYSGNIGSAPGLGLGLSFTPPTYQNLQTLNTGGNIPVPRGTVLPFAAQPIYSAAGRNANIAPYVQNRVTPYIQSFNVAIQRELKRNMTLDVSWVANKATKLFSPTQVNDTNIIENGLLDAFKVTQAGGNAPLFDRLFMGRNIPGVGVVNGTTITGSQAVRGWNIPQMRVALANGDIGALANFLNTATNFTGVTGGLIRDAGLPDNFIAVNPQFAGVALQGNNSNSTYHSGQFVLNNRFSRGLSMQTSYVFSKNMGDGALNGVLRSPRDRQLSKSLLANNRAHIFKINGSYELPFGKNGMIAKGDVADKVVGGWNLSPVFQWVSGAPLTFTTSRGTVGFRTTNTADILGQIDPGSVLKAGNGQVTYFQGFTVRTQPGLLAGGTNQQVLNSAGQVVLANPVVGTTGSSAQNLGRLTGPAQLTFNLSLSKRISVTESKYFTVRADAINIMNRANFGNPNTDINSANFGRIDSTLGSAAGQRTITINLRFDF